MNSVSTLEENFGEYLKQQMEHSKYEFRDVYSLSLGYERKQNRRDKLEKNSHKKGNKKL